ncbi:MAG: hypothetical protein QXF61_04075 [Nitrososphaeria archaeon]
MDKILKALETSVKHLQIIDEIFRNENYDDKALYIEFKEKIDKINDQLKEKFIDEIYVGGKKGASYGRQMILGDIFEYIINARGYYYAERSQKHKSLFIKLVIYLINQLIIWDSLTVSPKLRLKLLEKLEQALDKDLLFKEQDMRNRHEALKRYQGDLGFEVAKKDLPHEVIEMIGEPDVDKARRKLDDYFDSLLPKTGGGLWGELIVYLYLLRRNVGFVLPLLLNQRILSGNEEALKPPDFLVITDDGSIVGIEVGRGKETQSGRFSSVLKGCQMVTVENPRVPPRCPICGKKTLFCPKVIEDYGDIENNPLLNVKDDILCVRDCKFYTPEDVLKGKCPYTLYKGEVGTSVKPKQEIKFEVSYHYHYKCILEVGDKVALENVRAQWDRYIKSGRKSNFPKALKMNYPYVDGLENLEKKVPKEKIVCYGKYPNGRNCEFCIFVQQCEKVTTLCKTLQDLKGINRREALEKLKELF